MTQLQGQIANAADVILRDMRDNREQYLPDELIMTIIRSVLMILLETDVITHKQIIEIIN